jgi:O-antigen ligase
MIVQTYTVKNWVVPLIGLLLVQGILAALYLLHPFLPFLIVIAALSVYLLYFLFMKELFIWIVIMSVASGFDQAGRVIGGITIFHISWFLSMTAMVVYIMHNRGFRLNFATPINKYVFGYIGFSLFSLTYSPNIESGLLYLATTLALFLFFIFVVNFARHESHYKFIIYAMLMANLFISLLAFYQLLNFDPWNIINVTQSASGEKISRSTGTFHDPNVAATYLMIGIIFGMSLLLYSKTSLINKILIIGFSLISFGGMLATFSRTGWLALAAGIFVLLLFQKNKKNIFIVLVSGLAIFASIILFTKYGEFISERIFSIFDVMGDVSIRTRIYMGISGLWMFFDNPVLGIGYRGFPVLYDFYIHPLAPQVLLYMKESHTLVITLLAETGLIGVTIVFLWFKRVFKDNWQLLKKFDDGIMRAVLIGCFANFVALNTNFFFYGSLFPHFDLIWLVLGFIYSIYFISNSRERTDNSAPANSNN